MHEQPRKERHYLGWLFNKEGSKKVVSGATLYNETKQQTQKPGRFWLDEGGGMRNKRGIDSTRLNLLSRSCGSIPEWHGMQKTYFLGENEAMVFSATLNQLR